MTYTTQDLVYAQRHVSHGEDMVRQQRELLDGGELDDVGRRAAESWLAVFQAGLTKHIAQRDKIAEDLAGRFR